MSINSEEDPRDTSPGYHDIRRGASSDPPSSPDRRAFVGKSLARLEILPHSRSGSLGGSLQEIMRINIFRSKN